ncbi:MAG TPA: SDR family NAD(P)-dependent oxidoreductase [Actinomycetota bacterium]|nr:SDR family NAD(P)-dependent oxidoreductase [Actinomycetota bacterium]
MSDRFAGAVILVTGGAGGIGGAVAQELAGEGAHVAVADRDLERAEVIASEIAASGGSASAHRIDVANGESVRDTVADIRARHGTITHAVAAAGIIATRSFLELTADEWDATLAVNLRGTFLTFQAVAQQLVEASRGGSLVAISSVAGRGGRPNAIDYAASKAGVISLVRSAALALAAHGITVNAVCPGIVDTDMTRAIHAERAILTGVTAEESLARLAATIPLGRMETADDVAHAVAFLLSSDANYITGQALNVCGGLEFD